MTRILITMLGAILVFTSPATAKALKSSDEKEKKETKITGNISPDIPQSVVFAGERTDLTLQDRRERMDREILAFCYSHINTMLQIKRANRLFPIVEPILAKHGIPDDFKYLMIIECNGDIEARSTAGAAGPWQFLEKTGRQYGLEINGEVDERYNIEKATAAACRYLNESYEEYGDWLTVAASYNTGRANVTKRIEAQKEKKAIDLVLLPETSRYIFRLLAIKTVFSDPGAYGFILKREDLYPVIPIAETININKPVNSWAAVAKKHGLTYLQLHEANPWIRSAAMANKNMKSYKVKIPSVQSLKYDPKKTIAHDIRWITE
ncbi:MAG: lytic transglycosylase domain-containing protein [Bacteroidaceae bacterium]|nr:lytic transglycosylase domain-containing protein [Bacteroidaceae bacterium]